MNEIEEVPGPLLSEVLDFVHFLKAKVAREKLDIAIMSESSTMFRALHQTLVRWDQ
jgi:hypothetical protein